MRALGRARQPQVGVGARLHGGARGVGLEERREERLERVVPIVVARDGVDRLRHALERQPELRLVVDHRAVRVDDVGRDDDEAHVVATGDRQQLIAQHVLRRVAFAGVADDDEAKSPAAAPGGVTANVVAAPARGPATARTIASRQSSVRDSAHEFQMPDAQFSVSKNQLMPHTGTVAAMTAAAGRPVARLRRSAAGTE